VNAPVPAREKKEKKKTDPVPAEKLAEKLADLEGGDDDFANDSAKKRRGGKAGKENGEARKTAGARAAKAAKDKARSKKAEKPGSRKLSAMARAAANANDGLKRGHFETSDDPSSHGSIQKHAGGRPAKRHARAMLHSRFDAAATPGSPDVMTEHVPARWPEEDADPSPPPAYAPVVAARGAKKPGSGAGRYGQLASAAAAAAAAAKNVVGSQGEKLPAGRADGAWSSAYRTLQAAHIKLQTKYDKLKDTKLNGLITEAESYRMELADHGAKAEELIKHFRVEADRQKEAAAGAEGASSRAYELERENAELKETLLAYQGKILRVEQEAAAATQRAAEEAAASTSGRWGSEELEAFMGLRWDKQSTGVHHFTHSATGFAFQLSAADPASYANDDEETRERRRRESDVVSGTGALADEVSFVPLEFGKAAGYLPGYLSEQIEFERGEMPEFVGRMLGVLNQVAAEHVAPAASR
jgi:syntaxin 7